MPGFIVHHIPGIPCTCRFKKQDLHFFSGNRFVGNAPWHHQELSFIDGNYFFGGSGRVGANMHIKTAPDHQEQLIFRLVVVPDKFTFEFNELHLLSVQFTCNTRMKMIRKERQFFCNIYFFHGLKVEIPQVPGCDARGSSRALFKFIPMNDYERIKTAIQYIADNFQQQPDLDEVARQVHVSPFHFQRLFKNWAGVSPKKFLQYISVSHAKSLLQEKRTLEDVSFETGLSGTGRLHDLFIQIEGMTPGEFRNGGEQLAVNYSFAESPFGTLLVASTRKGICHLAFADDTNDALQELKNRFPRAQFRQVVDTLQQQALFIFTQDWKDFQPIKLHLKGTPFQLKVWEALLKIPLGGLTSYAALAAAVGKPGAARATGSAVAGNPVAFLIPCHRVIQSTGYFGQYHWGSHRKTAMIGWESAKIRPQE